MFYSILAVLFLIKLFKKSIYHAPKNEIKLQLPFFCYVFGLCLAILLRGTRLITTASL